MIGRELFTTHGLLEWFLSQRGQVVNGFSQAVFSGLTTSALSDLLAEIIEAHTSLSGLYHAASDPIDKCQLLQLLDCGLWHQDHH